MLLQWGYEKSVPLRFKDFRIGMVLDVGIIVVQALFFLIYVATPLGLITPILLANDHGETSVKWAISALFFAVRGRNFVPVSLLLDGEGSVTQSADTMRALGVRFNPAGPGLHITTERE